MGLAHKLYKIGILIDDDKIKDMIKNHNFKESEYTTLVVDFKIQDGKLIDKPIISTSSLDNLKTFFTKKIGGTSNSYYLYPNYEYQDESDLYKKFQAISHTIKNSIMIYANDNNIALAKIVFEYINNYKVDELDLKSYQKNDYFLVLLINGKTFYELMPEVLKNYIDEFVEPHIKDKNDKPFFKEQIDIISGKKELCGYSPNIKFFTMDNYDDIFKVQMIDKMPMSKDTAKAIKKGWMFAVNNLKFYYKGLEYIIIPSMLNFDKEVFNDMLYSLKESKNNLESFASREESFIWSLEDQVEKVMYIDNLTLDILFTKVNITNLSVQIFSTLEDIIPSRIRQVANLMKDNYISDSLYVVKNEDQNIKYTYLRDCFRNIEQFKNSNGLKGLENKIFQERIYLAKLLLGYLKIDYLELLKRFEHFREFDAANKKRMNSEKKDVKDWIVYPRKYVENEDKILEFLKKIDAIKDKNGTFF
ncbi:TM1802 family CRISPR-associated protein [Campylobacter sp. RM16187]|uniref:TM1802 family CRISPR-associated protein n=1 Tax=Campylobacter sp. RM16187 TaxID=1660063 RepID=UPI0021B659D7|nr:TM1802 family CRISPR-associated protein [Campylobacter sp. RM16187]QKG30218.1 CRISPR/Cas system-associated protein Cas8, type I-B/HMARI [Campylobacter sp. RM16187]